MSRNVTTQPNEVYKGHRLAENKGLGTAYIYSLDFLLKGITQSDKGKDNALEKAKKRIDNNRTNNQNS